MCDNIESQFDTLLNEIERLNEEQESEKIRIAQLQADIKQLKLELKEKEVELANTNVNLKDTLDKRFFSTAQSRRAKHIESLKKRANKTAKKVAKCKGKEFREQEEEDLISQVEALQELRKKGTGEVTKSNDAIQQESVVDVSEESKGEQEQQEREEQERQEREEQERQEREEQERQEREEQERQQREEQEREREEQEREASDTEASEDMDTAMDFGGRSPQFPFISPPLPTPMEPTPTLGTARQDSRTATVQQPESSPFQTTSFASVGTPDFNSLMPGVQSESPGSVPNIPGFNTSVQGLDFSSVGNADVAASQESEFASFGGFEPNTPAADTTEFESSGFESESETPGVESESERPGVEVSGFESASESQSDSETPGSGFQSDSETPGFESESETPGFESESETPGFESYF